MILTVGFPQSSSLVHVSCIWKHTVVLTVFIFGLQNEEKIRKSFQQQLADAIAIIKGMYQVGLVLARASLSLVSGRAPSWHTLSAQSFFVPLKSVSWIFRLS